MRSFHYIIQNTIGVRGYPARMLSKKASQFCSNILIYKDGRPVNPLRLTSLVGMGIFCGDAVTVEAHGSDEDQAIEALEIYFHQHLLKGIYMKDRLFSCHSPGNVVCYPQ